MKKAFFRFSIVTLIACLFVGSYSDDAEARRRRRRRARQPKVINEKKLFERMGGRDILSKSVDDWFRAAMSEASISQKLQPLAAKPSDLAKARKHLVDELCELADGPCETSDSEWMELRAKFVFDEPASVTFASLLSEALSTNGVGERERNELLGRLGSVDPMPVAESIGPASERRGGKR